MRTRFLWLIAAVWLAVLVSAAGGGHQQVAAPTLPDRPEDAEQQLVGSWLREDLENGVTSRRILRLDADGTFDEAVRLTDPAGTTTEHRHAAPGCSTAPTSSANTR